MDNVTDKDLIARFLEGDRHDSFRTLVERHSAMVYGCARRIVGDHQAAQDVAQAVFILLSRKAPTLKNHRCIAGWLHRCATFVARDTLKVSRRRMAREREAVPVESEANLWNELSVHLDSSMDLLPDSDRDAILLRFFQNRSFRDVGVALGLNEDTAQKRVSRALDRLRKLLLGRGVVLSAVMLASLVSANAAPATSPAIQALLATAASTATHTSVSVASILKSAIKAMFINKLKVTALAALAILLISGSVGYYAVQSRKTAEPVASVRGDSPMALLGDLAEAARMHDGALITSAIHVTDPDRKQRLKSLTQWIDAVGRFDRACRKAFGDEATDQALWNTPPRLLYRLEFGQENLAMANQTTTGNTAQVNIQRAPGIWQYVRFEKVGGVWKIHEEAVDDVASPADAIKYSKVAPVLDSITGEVNSGTIKSAKAAMERFAPEVTRIYASN